MENNKPKLTELMPAKVGAFILAVLTFAITLGFALAICIGFEMDVYRVSKSEAQENIISDLAYSTANDILTRYAYYGSEDAWNSTEGTNLTFAMYNSKGELVCGAEQSEEDYYCQTHMHKVSTEYSYEGYPLNTAEYTIKTFVDRDLRYDDQFRLAGFAVDTIYGLRYWGFGLAIISLLAFIVLFIFLMCSAGHRRGREGIWAGPITKIPFDLVTVAVIAIIIFLFYLLSDGFGGVGDVGRVILAALGVLAAIPLILGWCVDLAGRIKLGKWWRNTIIFMVLNLIWKILKAIGRGVAGFFKNLPLIWKTVLFMVALGIFAMLAIGYDDYGGRASVLLLGGIVVFALVCYIAVTLRKLQEAGEKIAEGDLDYRVDTKRMFGDFKQHGENLNSIGSGMTLAVDERLRSERLKTELITNVSHDIKTPLTSIINYVDLISKEDCDNEKIREYTEVLSRQSERLKKLIEDLVEASKASTGNMEVHFAPCDVGVMLEQTAAEYEDKIKASGLDLVVTKPDRPVSISADGRLLWRVFDNLMNNICKYAQPETRVYVSLEKQAGRAVITFKNISRSALNISPDELMERFVRGDSSRHTEGSGLGLNIAKSLTELQNGEMKLSIDGDLFKVTVSFDAPGE